LKGQVLDRTRRHADFRRKIEAAAQREFSDAA